MKQNIIQKIKSNETREGGASLIMVMFFTLLVGIIVIGFISIMVSNIISSSNYDLSQSAYNSALAGVEDAKIVLLKYNTCQTHANAYADCDQVIKAVTESGSADNCDIVRKALGRAAGDGNNETIIQSDNSSTSSANTKELSKNIDQAYTCVLIETNTQDYLGKITKDSNFKVIPLRTGNTTSNIASVTVEWINQEDISAATGGSYRPASTSAVSSIHSAITSADQNTFDTISSIFPAIQVGLTQTSATATGVPEFSFNDFQTALATGSTYASNRALAVLRPSTNSSAGTTAISAGDFARSALAGSTNYGSVSNANVINSPYDVKCDTSGAFSHNGYACSMTINLPNAVRGNSVSTRIADTTRFLTVSSLYDEPDISFRITMRDSSGNSIKYFGVQSKVDSTGRANDVFRRVESRIELTDVNFTYPKYALSVYCDDPTNCKSGEGDIDKHAWVTRNCFTLVNGEHSTCANYDPDAAASFD